MDAGSSSTAGNEGNSGGGGVWAKIVPCDADHREVAISTSEPTVRSRVAVAGEGEEVVWCEITPLRGGGGDAVARIRNLSSDAILVDETVVKDGTVDIKAGTKIIAGPEKDGYLAYTFEIVDPKSCDNSSLKILLDVEHAKCSICLNIWHDVVTVAPCFHNFCNGCFSEWIRRSSNRSRNKKQMVACPQCRTTVQSVGKNHFLHNIEEAILQSYSSLKHSDEEIALLDSYATVRLNLVLGKPKNQSRKRPLSPSREETSSDLPCPQCGVEFRNVRCDTGHNHLLCSGCGGMMPSRPDLGVPQKCAGCDKIFCGAYWHSQGVDSSQYNLICDRESFEAISRRSISRVPDDVHESNPYERDITERCILQAGKTVQAVISEWIVNFDNNSIDRSRLRLKHADSITSGTHLCNECYSKFVDFILYWYRVTLLRNQLPPDAADRQNCWYGYECRTQHHKVDHAKKMNHVCRPMR